MADEITIHGINFIRTGKCNSCPGCARVCLECPHGILKDGKQFCTIYNRREKVCPECSAERGKLITHVVCITFPSHPFLRVIKSGICAYKFKPKTKMDKKAFEELL